MATQVCLRVHQRIINYALQYIFSQRYCQLLAAAALSNCAATLDKMTAASFDHNWGGYNTSDLFWYVSTSYSLQPLKD